MPRMAELRLETAGESHGPALTTLLGLVPIVIQKPSLAGVYYYSMALVIMGGLLLSTFLTTVFLPATVCLVEDVASFIGSFPRRLRGLFARPSVGQDEVSRHL